MSIDFGNVPLCLAERNQWVLWRTMSRDGHPTKVPISIGGGEAKSNDSTTWGSFGQALERFKAGGYDGIGYVFSADDPFAGIDLDGCYNPKTGEIAKWAHEVVGALDSYSEISPSRTGIKVFVRGRSPFSTGKKRPIDAPTFPDGKAPALEIYDKLRYFAVTGWRVDGPSKQVEQRDLGWIREEFWPPEKRQQFTSSPASASIVERARRYMARMPSAISGQGGHNQTFRVACVLVLGFGLGDGEALGLMREYNARCEPEWSDRELEHKVRSAANQPGERNYLRDKQPAEWRSTVVPDYAEPKHGEQPPTERRGVTLQQATERYLEQLEQGKGNLLSLGMRELDDAVGGGVAPGEVVIIAARPSHGKSAVALQCVHALTKDGLKALIISEEMSALALGKRTIQFVTDVFEEDWKDSLQRVRHDLQSHFELRAEARILESVGSADHAAKEIRKAAKEGAQVVVVDYAQLLTSRGNSRYEEVTNTSIAMRQVASETGVVLLLLCQLSRGVESRPVFHPTLADLKDSGQLEQDSDVILFLCWPHRLDVKKDPYEFYVYVAKNRNRGIEFPTVKLRFEPTRQMLQSDEQWLNRRSRFEP